MHKYRELVRFILVLLLFCCASILCAQDEEINTYFSGFDMMRMLIKTLMWCAAYLPIYAAALVIPLAYLQLFRGFDSEMLLLIGLLWLGGMAINAAAYAIVPGSYILAALLTIPFIYGWTVLLCTRSWADYCVQDALKVAVIVAIVCAPYFGPTWHISKPKTLETYLRPAVQIPALRSDTVLSIVEPCAILPTCHTNPS